jgi:hypothetical protein
MAGVHTVCRTIIFSWVLVDPHFTPSNFFILYNSVLEPDVFGPPGSVIVGTDTAPDPDVVPPINKKPTLVY